MPLAFNSARVSEVRSTSLPELPPLASARSATMLMMNWQLIFMIRGA